MYGQSDWGTVQKGVLGGVSFVEGQIRLQTNDIIYIETAKLAVIRLMLIRQNKE